MIIWKLKALQLLYHYKIDPCESAKHEIHSKQALRLWTHISEKINKKRKREREMKRMRMRVRHKLCSMNEMNFEEGI